MPRGKVFPDHPAADAAEVECFFSGIKEQQNFRRLNLASRQNHCTQCVLRHQSQPQIRPPAVEFPAKQRAVNENALNAREEGRRVQPRTEPVALVRFAVVAARSLLCSAGSVCSFGNRGVSLLGAASVSSRHSFLLCPAAAGQAA